MRVLFVFYVVLSLIGTLSCSAQESLKKNITYSANHGVKFELQKVAEGLGVVWGMVFIDSTQMLLTEKSGQFKIFNLSTAVAKKVKVPPLSVVQRGQGGLMDVQIHPHFKKNNRVYFAYSKKVKGGQSTAVAYGTLKAHHIQNVKEIFVARPVVSSGLHFGARLAFDREGFLFVSLGDRGQRKQAQKLNSHLGKVLRITDEGKAPSDNPFVNHKSAFKEVWSLGHRNPQGLFFHPHTHKLWLNEHGPRGGDEINLVEKAANYGWPLITYGKEYWGPSIGSETRPGLKQPVKYYKPSIAPCGLLIYSGKMFKPWKGDFFSGALILRHLNRLSIKNKTPVEEERLLTDKKFRIRHVVEGPEGAVYFSTDEGGVFRITASPSADHLTGKKTADESGRDLKRPALLKL